MDGLELLLKEIPVVIKRDGTRIEKFDPDKIKEAVRKTIYSVDTLNSVNGGNEQIIDEVFPEIINNILSSRDKTGTFPSGFNAPSVIDFDKIVPDTLEQKGYKDYAEFYKEYVKDREKVRQKRISIRSRKEDDRDTTDKLLLIESVSQETEEIFDRRKIVKWLVGIAEVPAAVAWSVAKDVHQRLARAYDDGKAIPTEVLRFFVDQELKERGLDNIVEKNKPVTIPIEDIDQIIFQKSSENANVTANNPEAVNLGIAEYALKRYALRKIFSEDVSKAHLEGRIQLHDLGYPTRVYCSSHSLDYLKKFGLELENLDSTSGPAKHARTLTGHLNTFLASMQAYYAGALGVAHINVAYAPLLEADLEELRKSPRKFMEEFKAEMDESLEKLIESGASRDSVDSFKKDMEIKIRKISEVSDATEKDEDSYLRQEAQYMIFSKSQMAFSRGGQTLFLDDNIYTGIPGYHKENPAIGAGGNYHLRNLSTGQLIPLEEKNKEEESLRLTELWMNGKRVMDEKVKVINGKKIIERDYDVEDGFEIDKNKHYERTARRFTKAMLDVWRKGDERGMPFAFPKCDFHINEESFNDNEQNELLRYACQIASENGAIYFVFDRDSTTLSACCRLRTTIEDDYMLKHPESLRFCGFQNVSINLPQAAYRAGKGDFEALKRELKGDLELIVKAHQQKKEFIEKCGALGGPQHQTQKIAFDGRKYVNLDEATYIIGLVGLNECVQYSSGKELHEDAKACTMGRDLISWIFAEIKKLSKTTGLKLSLEETPAESTARRFAKADLKLYREQARQVVKGDENLDTPYYTNSIHFRADAPISFIDRVRYQSKLHPLIESGAIIHDFVGEKKPSSEAIYNFVKKVFYETQAAQITISPEFLYCNSCRNVSAGFKLKTKRRLKNGEDS